jgi:hypothetical protein
MPPFGIRRKQRNPASMTRPLLPFRQSKAKVRTYRKTDKIAHRVVVIFRGKTGEKGRFNAKGAGDSPQL